jgi:hypothetical protein
LSEIWETGELKQSKMPLSFVVEPIHTMLAHNRDLIKSITPSMTHFVKRLVSLIIGRLFLYLPLFPGTPATFEMSLAEMSLAEYIEYITAAL